MPMAVRYLCAGPLLLAENLQRIVLDLEASLSGTAIEDVAAIADDYHLGVSVQRSDEDDWEFCLRAARARRGCGTDLTGLIERLPVDRQEYEVTCPSCGNVATVVRHPE